MKTITFLGGGRITGALAAGLRLAGDQRALIVYDRNLHKLRQMHRESRVEIARDLRSAVNAADLVFVAVRPGSVPAMLAEVADTGAAPGLCVSLAAGIPLKNLRSWLPAARWGRAMPSPVCRIGRGLTPVCFDRRVKSSERQEVCDLFQRVGPVLNLPEDQFDAITATHSPTHGYHALAALAAAAEKSGLSRKTALIAAAHALADGILYWRESGADLAELLHEAATPRGIAAATMKAMDRAGYRGSVEKGLAAGVGQARKNAKIRN